MTDKLDIDKEGMLDVTPLIFGKYRGKTPDQVVEKEGARGKQWLCWAFENVAQFPVCSAALYRSLGGKKGRAIGAYGGNTPQQKTHNQASQSTKMKQANDKAWDDLDNLDGDVPF